MPTSVQVRDASTVKDELVRMLVTIAGSDDPTSIDRDWKQIQWDRTEVIAGQAAELSGKFDALNKMARYVQFRGKLWTLAYETQEEWVGDLRVHSSMSRSTLFALASDIDMARKAGLTYDEVFDLLSSAPTALRDARTNWLDQHGEFKDGLNLPDGGAREALINMTELGPGEARAYATFDIGKRVQRFIKDARYVNGTLLMTMIVRPDDEEDYDVSLFVSEPSGGTLAFDDMAWLSRRAGKEIVVANGDESGVVNSV